METFLDILRNGKNEDIIKFMADKNIFNTKLFKFEYIYWKLGGDKPFYQDVVKILQ